MLHGLHSSCNLQGPQFLYQSFGDGAVPSAPITIDITVTFMLHSFFSSLAKSKYLSLFSLSFSFTLWLAGTAKSAIRQFLFFFFVDYH